MRGTVPEAGRFLGDGSGPDEKRKPVYFIAFVIIAALVYIVLPLALTHGR